MMYHFHIGKVSLLKIPLICGMFIGLYLDKCSGHLQCTAGFVVIQGLKKMPICISFASN